MNGFNYWSSSEDNKMRGSVSAHFITEKISNRTVVGTGSGGDNKFFEVYFTDGSRVKFVLNDIDADILYYAPSR